MLQRRNYVFIPPMLMHDALHPFLYVYDIHVCVFMACVPAGSSSVTSSILSTSDSDDGIVTTTPSPTPSPTAAVPSANGGGTDDHKPAAEAQTNFLRRMMW